MNMEQYYFRPRPNEPDGKWRTWQINGRLLRNIYKFHDVQRFTNNDAYRIYAAFHARSIFAARVQHLDEIPPNVQLRIEAYAKNHGLDDFQTMNVRNSLCAAAERGVLVRWGAGEYSFDIDAIANMGWDEEENLL